MFYNPRPSKVYRLPPAAGPRVPYATPPVILPPAPPILIPPVPAGDIGRDPRLPCPFVPAARLLDELPVLECLTSAVVPISLLAWWEWERKEEEEEAILLAERRSDIEDPQAFTCAFFGWDDAVLYGYVDVEVAEA